MKPTPLSPSTRSAAPRRFGALSVAVASLLAAFAPSSRAMHIMCDMNGLPVSQYTTVGALHCGGTWCVFNGSPTSSQVSSVINNIGTGTVIAENSYPYVGNFNTAKASGHTPNAAFSYHETGSAYGGTVLTTDEINHMKDMIGGSSVIILTRGYHTGWLAPVNTALANPNCSGVAYEIEPSYGDPNNPDIVACIDYCIAHNKNIYLLFPYASKNGGTYYSQLRSEFRRLLQLGANLADDHVTFVLSNYNANPAAWTGATEGSNTMQASLIWANNQNTWPGRYYFQNQFSNLEMSVVGADTANNAVVDQSNREASANHQWFLLYATGGRYNLLDVNSNLAASVQGDSTANGAGVVQFSINGIDGSSGQLWTPQLSGSAWLFYNSTGGKVLDDNNTRVSGTQLIQGPHNGASTQLWTLINVP